MAAPIRYVPYPSPEEGLENRFDWLFLMKRGFDPLVLQGPAQNFIRYLPMQAS